MDDREKERFSLSYVFIDDCWIWIRSKVTGGYGSMVINGKTKRAHRVSYELAYGVILTPDQFLHHVCRNKDCVNPEHLEIVSQLTHTDSATYGNKEKLIAPMGMNILLRTLIGTRAARAENAISANCIGSKGNISEKSSMSRRD